MPLPHVYINYDLHWRKKKDDPDRGLLVQVKGSIAKDRPIPLSGLLYCIIKRILEFYPMDCLTVSEANAEIQKVREWLDTIYLAKPGESND